MFGTCDKTNWRERRGPRLIGRVLLGIAIAVAFALGFGVFVQLLWNWLMPAVFGLSRITYGEAFGMLLLARLLFGGMGHRRDHAGYLTGKYGFRPIAWRGHGCSKEDAAHGNIEDWRHYDAWWEAEGREAFKKYTDSRGK